MGFYVAEAEMWRLRGDPGHEHHNQQRPGEKTSSMHPHLPNPLRRLPDRRPRVDQLVADPDILRSTTP